MAGGQRFRREGQGALREYDFVHRSEAREGEPLAIWGRASSKAKAWGGVLGMCKGYMPRCARRRARRLVQVCSQQVPELGSEPGYLKSPAASPAVCTCWGGSNSATSTTGLAGLLPERRGGEGRGGCNGTGKRWQNGARVAGWPGTKGTIFHPQADCPVHPETQGMHKAAGCKRSPGPQSPGL